VIGLMFYIQLLEKAAKNFAYQEVAIENSSMVRKGLEENKPIK